MSASGDFDVPPGQYPPFATVTDKDHAAWIIIATSLGLAWTLLFGAIRVFIRYTISPGLGIDDACLAVATLLTVIQSCVLLGACSMGLGKTTELVALGSQVGIQKMYYTSELFFVIALGLSKISMSFFLLRLTMYKNHRKVYYSVAALIAAWTVASLFAIALKCDLGHPWIILDEKCPGEFMRWKVIGAFDIIFELALFGMSIYLVWGLYTSLANKAVVVSAFAFRLPMIIIIAFRLANFNKHNRSTNPFLAEDLFIVWTQTELNYSLIAATVPSLRSFGNILNTQFGGITKAEGNEYANGTGSGTYNNKTGPGTYQMSHMRSANRELDPEGPTAGGNGLDGHANAYSYGIWVPTTGADIQNGNPNQPGGGKRGAGKTSRPREDTVNGDTTSVGSNDSRRMIIRKDITFEVEHEDI